MPGRAPSRSHRQRPEDNGARRDLIHPPRGGTRVTEAPTGDPADLEERRSFEEALLAGSVAQSIIALMEHAGVTQTELAARLGWSQPRISQILRAENMELATAADLAWGLGYRLELVPTAANREGTPAGNDPAPPRWTKRK